jgi:hypothetical protein
MWPIMTHRFPSAFAGLAVASAVICSPIAGRSAAATNRTVYVTMVDKAGAPVTDLQAADLEVKEGGKTMEIVSVKPATAPLRIAIIDSDAGSGAYQAGVQAFMNKLLGNAEFALTSVIIQAKLEHDYSSDPAVLEKGLNAIGRRGTERGGQLVETINEVAKTVRADGKRGIILALRVGGEASTTMSSDDVRAQIRKSGATFYAMTFKGVDQKGQAVQQSVIGQGVGQQAVRNDEQTIGSTNLQQVLGDGSKESGGHYDEVVGTLAAKMLEGLANEILHQYEVVYAVPDGVKPGDKLAISTKRKNVTLYAPNHPPM